MIPGAVEVTPDDPLSIAEWDSDAPGNEVYEFYRAALPAAGLVIERDAPGDLGKQIDLAYEYTLSRPATELERSIALKIAKEQSLAAFTHVVFNLSEFLFMR